MWVTERDDYFLRIATEVKMRSTCARSQVGCVIVDEYQRIVATGYNGTPSGYPHCLCTEEGDPCDDTIHAEINALITADYHRIHTVYVTSFPCKACAMALANTPMKRLVYRDLYRDMSGSKYFTHRGVFVYRRERRLLS